MMDIKQFRELYDTHNAYWDAERREMRQLRNAYSNRYWDKAIQPDQVLIEVPRAYEYIEGYVASLFARNPAVVVKADLRGAGTPSKVQAICNEFLNHVRTQLEDATRLALIYPCSYLKLSFNTNSDVFRRVSASAVAPWDCIVDLDASSWADQSYCAHRYYITEDEARERFGNRRFSKHNIVRYLDQQQEESTLFASYQNKVMEDERSVFSYIEIVELYNLADNRFYIWSPDYSDGNRWLQDGVEIITADEEGNEEKEKYRDIPFTDGSGQPIAPIVPLYYSRMPDLPMRGYSALRRVYDQIQETNIIRSYQAAMVRRAARQWVIEKGVFSDESLSKIAQGQDGEFIECELSQGQQLQGSIMAVPHSPVPAELQNYIIQVGDDLQRGSVMAPFTRGEATKATATEVTALAAYTSTEVGRLARERDNAIEKMAELYISMMRVFLGEDSDIVLLNGKPEVISANDLQGNFGYYAQDSGSTPISEAIQKQEFMQTVPLLQQLGVPPQQILKELIRVYDLPESLLPEALTSTDAEKPQPSQMGMTAEQLPPAEAVLGLPPNPKNIRQVLP